MATTKFSVRIETNIYSRIKNILKDTNYTLSEVINATLYDFLNKDVDSRSRITSNYKWLRRHDKETLKELKEEE